MERTLLPAVDVALPVSTGPGSSSVSDSAYNGAVTGSEVLRLAGYVYLNRKFLSLTSNRLFCLMVTCIAWGHTTRTLAIVDNAGGEWSGAVGSELQQR